MILKDHLLSIKNLIEHIQLFPAHTISRCSQFLHLIQFLLKSMKTSLSLVPNLTLLYLHVTNLLCFQVLNWNKRKKHRSSRVTAAAAVDAGRGTSTMSDSNLCPYCKVCDLSGWNEKNKERHFESCKKKNPYPRSKPLKQKKLGFLPVPVPPPPSPIP